MLNDLFNNICGRRLKEDIAQEHYFKLVKNGKHGLPVIIKISHRISGSYSDWLIMEYNYDEKDFSDYRSSADSCKKALLNPLLKYHGENISRSSAYEIIKASSESLSKKRNSKNYKYFIISGEINFGRYHEFSNGIHGRWIEQWDKFSNIVKINGNGGWGIITDGEYKDFSNINSSPKNYFLKTIHDSGVMTETKKKYRNIIVDRINKTKAKLLSTSSEIELDKI